ncbi:MAG: RluA family pseudouridine synthase [Verrucomicrobiota bacterium]
MNSESPKQDDDEFVEIVPDHHAGNRIDVFMSSRFEQWSRSVLQKMIRQGRVSINGAPCKPADIVRAGDRIQVRPPEPADETIRAMDLNLDILYEDEAMLVINKPAGLVVHPTRGHANDTLVNALLAHDPEAFQAMVDEERRPGIVHRLDKDTSGAMVVARTQQAWQELKDAFAERRVEKTYLTVVIGEFGAKTGRFDGAIGRHPVNRKRMAVLREGGKPALTFYRVLGSACNLTLLEVRIMTGRTHQIRVHFAREQHPVLADPIYGGRQRDIIVPAPRLMLHAWKLTIPHPVDGVMRQYMAPPPEDFRSVLAAANLPDISPGNNSHSPEMEQYPVL